MTPFIYNFGKCKLIRGDRKQNTGCLGMGLGGRGKKGYERTGGDFYG